MTMPLLVSGIAMDYSKPSRSRRYYSPGVVEKALAELNAKIAAGEHIPGTFIMDERDVSVLDELGFNETNTSHLVREAKLDGAKLIVSVMTVSSPLGNLLEAAIRADKIAFRPQGTGKVNKDGEVYDYHIISIGAYDPSLV